MAVLKRPPLTRDWRDRAECALYDNTEEDWWSIGDPGEEHHTAAARPICVEQCPVREECLRRALREGTYGVIRGGIEFNTSHRVRCKRCRYAVADRRTRICYVCANYDPCLGGCGRMVHKDAESWYCTACKVTEQELLMG